jgi:short-subunit dehydrogenase
MPLGLFGIRNIAIGGIFYYSFDFWFDYFKFYYYRQPDLAKKYGRQSFAVITAATNELGYEFAEIFARQGFNLILISNDKEKLDLVSESLKKKYSIYTLPLKIDLSKNIEYEINVFSSQSRGLDISVIINNALFVGNKKFEELEFEDIANDVRMICGNSAKIVYSLIPRLKQRVNKSAIINVSSILAGTPINSIGFYSAINAFNHYLSVALADDLDSKIDILSFLTETIDLEKCQKNSYYFLVTPKEAVSECLKDLGIKRVTTGHYKTTLIRYMMDLLPSSMMNKFLEDRLTP